MFSRLDLYLGACVMAGESRIKSILTRTQDSASSKLTI